MKLIFSITTLALFLSVHAAEHDFIQATRKFPKFDEIAVDHDYVYGQDFDKKAKAIFPAAYQELLPLNEVNAIHYLPPLIVTWTQWFPESRSMEQLSETFKYMLKPGTAYKSPVCFFTYTAREACDIVSASPHTVQNVTRACLRIMSGHAIDLTDKRLVLDEEQEGKNKHTLINHIPCPLREIFLEDRNKYKGDEYLPIFDPTRPVSERERTRYKDEIEKIIGAVFQVVYCGALFSKDYQPNRIVYPLAPVIRDIVSAHNSMVYEKSTYWFISPQTTVDMNHALRCFFIDKKEVYTLPYSKAREQKHFKEIAEQFPKTLGATVENITTDYYLGLAFQAHALSQKDPDDKCALVERRVSSFFAPIEYPLFCILQKRGLVVPMIYDVNQDVVKLFYKTFEEAEKRNY